MIKYFYCIDVGGTDVKGGVIDSNYKILCSDKISSSSITSPQSLKDTIIQLLSKLEINSHLKIEACSGIGIGLPGLVDQSKGTIEYLPNLKISKYNIVESLKSEYNVPIKIANDAELALLAEHRLGSGKNHNDFALVTLGTGLGLGLMINGKPFRSFLPFSSEYGHNVANQNGDSLESLVSSRALCQQITNAIKKDKSSKLCSCQSAKDIDLKLFFDFIDNDKTAKLIFDNYISNLGRCLVNLYNVFTPSVIVIGGGISSQGEKLTKPLEEFVNNNIFLKNINLKTKIVPATFLNDAGIIGARCLFN